MVIITQSSANNRAEQRDQRNRLLLLSRLFFYHTITQFYNNAIICLCMYYSLGDICPAGYFCPLGSKRPNPCTLGYYCAHAGLKTPTARCSAGYYCNDSSTTPNQAKCPPGYYCPNGTGVPKACPAGTFSGTYGNVKLEDCQNCTSGRYCAGTGLDNPTDDCAAGYYCPGGQSTSTPLGMECTRGHYCPRGSPLPRRCKNGEYQNEPQKESCKTCLARYYCNNTFSAVINPVLCETGHYCPEGTGDYRDYPCPERKYSWLLLVFQA